MSEDIKICLCKTLKLLSNVCVTFSKNHPILSLSTLCMFLLYVACPFAFWVLVHSIPLVVCTCILFAFSFNTGNKDTTTSKRSITRVHSVRQRRAKEFARGEENENTRHVEDKNELREEKSPEEIREVEVALVSETNGDDKSNVITKNKVVMEEKEEGDRKLNKMDYLISDNERSKRLESLIARRRLMNKGRKRDLEVTSIDIPKVKNMSRLLIPSSDRAVEPSPGSAPSVLAPLRSPFDLPYDPHEEKPDLTGDDFEQEFMPANSRDMMMFCRHESFLLKPFLPGEFNRSLKEISFSVPESRIRRGASCSQLHQSSLSAARTDREFVPALESSQPIANEKSSESDSSSEEEASVFKVDREAILRSLSFMARRTPPQEKPEFYYTDRPTPTTKRDPSSISIASDMQVEVSELSSPPLTIDENLSYVYNDDESRSIRDAESWAGSSHFDYSQVDEYESRLPQGDERIGSLRGDFPEETNTLTENQCDHPWCSTAEYHSKCRTPRATTLEEKIEKTLLRSFSLTPKSSSRGDFAKPEECSHRFNKSEGSNTLDAVTGSNILHENNTETAEATATVEEGRLSNECHNRENSAEQSIPPSEETLPEYQERVTGSTIVEEQLNLGSTQHSEGGESSGVSNSDQDQEQPPNIMPNAALELVQRSPSPKSVLGLTSSLASLDHYMDDEVHAVDARAVRGLSPAAHPNSGDLPGIENESSEPSNDDDESEKQGESSQVHSHSEDEVEATEEISSMPFVMDDETSSKENLTTSSHSTDHSNDLAPPLSADEEEQSRREEIGDDGKDKPSGCEVQTETSALHDDKGDA